MVFHTYFILPDTQGIQARQASPAQRPGSSFGRGHGGMLPIARSPRLRRRWAAGLKVSMVSMGVPPIAGWFTLENPMKIQLKWDDLGVPPLKSQSGKLVVTWKNPTVSWEYLQEPSN